MINGYVSAKVIINRLYRELGSTVEIPESDVIEWIADAMSMIGSYYQYDECSTEMELTDGRAKLPTNFYKLIDVKYQNTSISWNSSSFNNDYYCEDCEAPPSCCTEYDFYINNSYIITNIKALEPDNILCMRYLGVAIDNEGYPMVPEDIYFFKALVAYCTYMMDYREWRKGNVPDKVMQKSEKDWLFYVNSAKGSANMPNIGVLENLKNIMTRLMPQQAEYIKGFRNLGKPERRKRF